MSRARGAELVCHRHDSLVSYEDHHVWPVGYHGPDVPSNIVRICCNAHSDIHYLMERLLRGKPVVLAEYGPVVRTLAQRGQREVIAYGESLAVQSTSEGVTP